jgi:NAD(P)-dependent dehydrogenase (short-subunit alcohol dehydrogenase family)
MPLKDVTFVITGSARGIGAATAAMAASRGANVVVSDVIDDVGEATVARIVADGGRAIYAHCDVTSQADVDALMAAAVSAFGGIDVLHNNAGIHETMISNDFTFESMSVETFDRVMNVNVRGAFICTKAALPFLKQSKRSPSVINAGSTASWVGYPYGLAYGTSKGAISLFTKNLAVALAPFGIRANCYCPASVDTDMVKDVMATLAASMPAADGAEGGAEGGGSPIDTHLVHRIGESDDVAELVCFLASHQSSFVNGVTWLIDGGVLAWRDSVASIGM